MLRGADGSEDGALCLVGGQFLGAPAADVTNERAARMDTFRLHSVSRAVTCSYDGETWWDAAPLPIGVALGGAVAVNATIVLAGGLYSSPPPSPSDAPPTYNSSAQPFEPGWQPMFVSVTQPDPACAGAAAADGAGGTPRLPGGGAAACLNITNWAAFTSPWTPQEPLPLPQAEDGGADDGGADDGGGPPARLERLWHRATPVVTWVEGPAWYCEGPEAENPCDTSPDGQWEPRLVLSGGHAEGAFPFVFFEDAWELRAANASAAIAAAAAAAAALQPPAGTPMSASWWPLPPLGAFASSSLRPPSQVEPLETFLLQLQLAPGAALNASNSI